MLRREWEATLHNLWGTPFEVLMHKITGVNVDCSPFNLHTEAHVSWSSDACSAGGHAHE